MNRRRAYAAFLALAIPMAVQAQTDAVLLRSNDSSSASQVADLLGPPTD